MGIATGAGVGTATMTATYALNPSISDTATLEVTPAVLESIEVTPNPVEVEEGATVQLTATGHYSDSSTQDITELVGWTGHDMSIITVDKGMVTGVTDGSTVIYATSTDRVSSEEISVTVQPFELALCGNEINNDDTSNAAGECLKVATDASGNWFTNTPSLAVMDILGYRKNSDSTNSGDSYGNALIEDGTSGPSGEFAQFSQEGINRDGSSSSLPGDGDDANAGIDGQFDRWCQKLSALEFGGKTTWRCPTRDELFTFYQEYDGVGGLWSARGWPTGDRYWASTVDDLRYKRVGLSDGVVSSSNPSYASYASCISNS